MTLKDKTLFVSGGSRGIGLEIARRAARDGANVALIAKTGEPDPRLAGTVYTAAEQIEAAGGHALPIVGDIRDESAVAAAVAATVERFGGIDVCVNNASAINLSGTEALEMKHYDLMQDINTRGTFVVSRACIPHLRRAENPHILTLSPPISLQPRWLGPHIAYTIAKYGMTLCALGFAAELREDGIASNALWPRTLIATAAVQNLLGGDEAMAAHHASRSCTRTPPTGSSPVPAANAPAMRSYARTSSSRTASPISTSTRTSRARRRKSTCSWTTSEAMRTRCSVLGASRSEPRSPTPAAWCTRGGARFTRPADLCDENRPHRSPTDRRSGLSPQNVIQHRVVLMAVTDDRAARSASGTSISLAHQPSRQRAGRRSNRCAATWRADVDENAN